MNTTRAMLVIGIVMLVLAVIVAQGLRPDEATTVSGPMISGTVSNVPEVPPATPEEDETTSGGVLVPLDSGTLKMDSTTPATGLAAVSPTELPQADDASRQTPDEAPAPVADKTEPVSPVQEKPAATEKKTEPSKSTPLIVTTSAPKTLAPGQKAISRTRLEIGPRSATFRLTGVADLQGKAFALKEPDRIVVDLNGAWGINLGKTPNNTILKSVRAGNQEANTRLVFDMHRPPRSFKLVQVAPKTLELQIR